MGFSSFTEDFVAQVSFDHCAGTASNINATAMATAPRELHPRRANAGCRQLLRGRKLRRGWRSTVFSRTPGLGGFSGHLRRDDSPLFVSKISGLEPTTDGPRWRLKKSILPQPQSRRPRNWFDQTCDMSSMPTRIESDKWRPLMPIPTRNPAWVTDWRADE